MSELEEMINKHTRNNGDYIPDYKYNELIKDIKDYTKKKCKEQRDLCADRSSIGNMEFVENAPEPKFD